MRTQRKGLAYGFTTCRVVPRPLIHGPRIHGIVYAALCALPPRAIYAPSRSLSCVKQPQTACSTFGEHSNVLSPFALLPCTTLVCALHSFTRMKRQPVSNCKLRATAVSSSFLRASYASPSEV